MESDQKNIVGIVLPLFGIEVKDVDWGEWDSSMMTHFAPLKVNGKEYVIVQDELDGFPDDTSDNWSKDWLDNFQSSDFEGLPFALEHPIKALHPTQVGNVHNKFVVCLEENPSSLNFYLLFEE